MYVCVCVCLYVCMYVCLFVRLHVCINIYIYLFICLFIYLFLFIYFYLFICLYICFFMHLYIHLKGATEHSLCSHAILRFALDRSLRDMRVAPDQCPLLVRAAWSPQAGTCFCMYHPMHYYTQGTRGIRR